MKIQYFSDVHLEFGQLDAAHLDADVIVAAGDIGVGLQGSQWLQELGKPTIYVAGNHEYYGGDIVHTRSAIVESVNDTEVRFLENAQCEIDGVRFLGATLWTDFYGNDAKVQRLAKRYMNDYKFIQCASAPLTPEQLYDINWESRYWLACELAKPYAGKTVVVTHHAPSTRSWPAQNGKDFLGTYCNELEDYFTRFDIDLWVHGHIHHPSDYYIERSHIVCNPRGYDGHQTIDGFHPTKTLEI